MTETLSKLGHKHKCDKYTDHLYTQIYENYFHGVKMSEAKPKNQMSYADELEMLEEKLHPFHVDTVDLEVIGYDDTKMIGGRL